MHCSRDVDVFFECMYMNKQYVFMHLRCKFLTNENFQNWIWNYTINFCENKKILRSATHRQKHKKEAFLQHETFNGVNYMHLKVFDVIALFPQQVTVSVILIYCIWLLHFLTGTFKFLKAENRITCNLVLYIKMTLSYLSDHKSDKMMKFSIWFVQK